MVIGKMKPLATVVAQFAAGVEVTAIEHEGKMFLPVMAMGEFSKPEPIEGTTKKSTSKKAEPVHEEEEEPTKESSKEKPSSDKTYTKNELMEMESKELVKILKDSFGIDPDDHEGKNTNKKLRDLILDAQKEEKAPAKTSKKAVKEEEPEDDEDSSEEGATEDSLVDEIATILEDFDGGKKNKKKTISSIVALGDDVDSDAVAELITEFEDDAEADIDEMATKLSDIVNGKKPKKETKKAPAKKSKKTEALVEIEDLEVGDRVSVYWADENEDWFDGKVESIKKGKVMIAYDDDTKEAIDPEVHTKIKKLAE